MPCWGRGLGGGTGPGRVSKRWGGGAQGPGLEKKGLREGFLGVRDPPTLPTRPWARETPEERGRRGHKATPSPTSVVPACALRRVQLPGGQDFTVPQTPPIQEPVCILEPGRGSLGWWPGVVAWAPRQAGPALSAAAGASPWRAAGATPVPPKEPAVPRGPAVPTPARSPAILRSGPATSGHCVHRRRRGCGPGWRGWPAVLGAWPHRPREGAPSPPGLRLPSEPWQPRPCRVHAELPAPSPDPAELCTHPGRPLPARRPAWTRSGAASVPGTGRPG